MGKLENQHWMKTQRTRTRSWLRLASGLGTCCWCSGSRVGWGSMYVQPPLMPCERAASNLHAHICAHVLTHVHVFRPLGDQEALYNILQRLQHCIQIFVESGLPALGRVVTGTWLHMTLTLCLQGEHSHEVMASDDMFYREGKPRQPDMQKETKAHLTCQEERGAQFYL